MDEPLALTGRPGERATAEDVRVDVLDGLAGVGPRVEHHTVTGVGHAFGPRDLVRQRYHVVKQAVIGLGEGGHVLVVLLGNDQDMQRRLRVDVAERQGTVTLEHARGGHLTVGDSAEQAVGHVVDPTGAGHAR
jgi:hypothetical protein